MDEPVVIVNSGSSVKTLGDYIEQEAREEMLRKQISIQQEEIDALHKKIMFLEVECQALMAQLKRAQE